MTDTHDDIIQMGRLAFCFNPDEEFDSVKQLLKIARRRFSSKYYPIAAASFLESIAKIIDTKNNDSN